MTIAQELLDRADNQCELCDSTSLLREYEVPSDTARDASINIEGKINGIMLVLKTEFLKKA